MKRCPSCARVYDDDSVRFCFDDGAELVAGTGAVASVAFAATGVMGSGASSSPTPQPTYEEQVTMPRDATRFGESLAVGTPVGEYVVDGKIGEGGMGVIFSASHPIIGKRVAIKVLNPAMANNPDVVNRFIQEAKSVNQIRDRNIVDIFSFGMLPDGRHYFVMEFLEGESMAHRLHREALPWSEAMQIWLQVASAVDAAHHKGIVHRDLKPDNIFLTPSPEGAFVKVLDFGIAKLLGDGAGGMTQTSVGTPIGTPTYMAPEQALGAKVDARTDLYAFGVILFETISGRPPFMSPTLIQLLNDHINNPPPALETLAQGVDAELVALVHELLAKEPSQRPPNMSEVRRRLTAMRDRALSEGTPLYGTAMPASASRPKPKKPPMGLIVGTAVATLVAIVGAGIAVVRSRPAAQPVVAVAPTVAPAAPAAPRPGRVTLSTNTSSTRVYLDPSVGERSTTPVAAGGDHLRVTVPPNKDWILRVESDGYKPHTMPLRIGDGEETALPVVLVPDAPAPTPVAVTPAPAHKKDHGTGKPKTAESTDKPVAKKVENGKFLDPFGN